MKSYKKILITLSVVLVFGMGVGYAIMYPVEVGLCPQPQNWYDMTCTGNYPSLSLGEPLFIVSATLFIVLLVFIFLSESYFIAWRKFAVIFLPISAFLIFITPSRGNDYVADIDRGKMVALMSGLFFVISLSIVIYQRYFKKLK